VAAGQAGKRQLNMDGRIHKDGFFGGTYFLAFLGAAIYFIQHSAGLWGGVIGFLKAVVWPVLVTYKVFGLLNM